MDPRLKFADAARTQQAGQHQPGGGQVRLVLDALEHLVSFIQLFLVDELQGFFDLRDLLIQLGLTVFGWAVIDVGDGRGRKGGEKHKQGGAASPPIQAPTHGSTSLELNDSGLAAAVGDDEPHYGDPDRMRQGNPSYC